MDLAAWWIPHPDADGRCVVLVHGYGYPAWRGGPMHEADAIGIPEVLGRVEALHAASGPGWEPAPLLQQMAAAGKRFADLNG